MPIAFASLRSSKRSWDLEKVNCKRCIYYYVTWQAATPHGCKAFGFVSKMIPSQQVRKDSGSICGMYQEKSGIKK
jgi:hypothetical protein